MQLEQQCREVEVLEADSADGASLERLAASTHVVMSTVGPFTRYGEPLIAACVNQGTDYCDITGETYAIKITFFDRDCGSRDTYSHARAR
mgnify:CR=1 FL=1